MHVPKRRGAVAVFVVVTLVALFGFTALTIDVGYLYNVRAELQNTADAAALAGAQLLPDEAAARETAREYANRNNASVVNDADVVLGNWSWTATAFTPNGTPVNAVHVLGQRSTQNGNPVQLFFAPLLGVSNANVSASATAAYGRAKRWDVVIVQDVTGSFADEIDEARAADQGLLDCIRENAPDTYLGLVTFTGYGWLNSGLKNVEDNYSALSSSIGSIKKCGSSGMPPCSGTNIGAGIDKAMPLLPESDRPRAMIIVSDGMPQSSLPGYSDDDLADWAIASANQAHAEGISIFTLFYSGNDGREGADEFLAGLIRGDGTSHETPDPAEMATELAEICREGMTLMLVE